MPLPNVNQINPTGHVAQQGVNPNTRTQQVNNSPGAFKTWANQMATNISENISPMNFVRQGTYNAFGNNAATRSALGAVDTTVDALTSFLSGKKDPEDSETKVEKLIKEQIRIAVETEDILKHLVEVIEKGALGFAKKDESDLNDLNDKGDPNYKKTKQERVDDKTPVFDLLTDISSNVIDIKGILTNGFDKMYETFDKEKTTRHVHDDIEDAVIIKETRYSKSRDLEIKKHNVNVEKMLKSISKNTDKTVSLLSEKPISTAEDMQEGKRKPKFMGDVEEVDQNKLRDQASKQSESSTSALLAILTTATTIFFKSIKEGLMKLTTKIVEWFKSGIELIGRAFTSAWNFVKDGVSSLVEKSKKAWEMVEDFGKRVADKAKGLVDNIAKKVPEVIKGAPKILEKGGQMLLGGAKKAAKFIPGLGLLATAGITAYDAFDAASNAESILDIEGRDASWSEKIAAGAGGAAESLSFGLLDKKESAQWLNSLMSMNDDKNAMLTENHKELMNRVNQIPAPVSPAANAPVVVNTENNSYYSGRKNPRNDDDSFNRYLDKHYAF